MAKERNTWARVQMLAIAAVFLGPLLVAAVMYYGGYLQPEGRTNHGALLQPVENLENLLGDTADGQWILLYTNDGECSDVCRDALYTIRQSRRMLGKEMDRVTRVFLHSDSPPDTLFLAAEHAGLTTLKNEALSRKLENKKPATLPAGGYFLLDPLGNLVMYFEPAIDPSDMVDDIKRLLKYSHIG